MDFFKHETAIIDEGAEIGKRLSSLALGPCLWKKCKSW